MKKNYYGILKVNKKAKPDQIKKAYRNAAKCYHPDISPEHGEKFREIQEAYETLSNPEKRARYDRELNQMPAYKTESYDSQFRDHPRFRSALTKPASLFGEIDRLFDEFDYSWFGDLHEFFKERDRDLSVEVTLTSAEAKKGCEIHLRVPFTARCSRCHGRGSVGGLICGLCRGRGEEKLEKKIKVTIPPGVKSGMGIRMPLHDPDLRGVHLIATLKVSR